MEYRLHRYPGHTAGGSLSACLLGPWRPNPPFNGSTLRLRSRAFDGPGSERGHPCRLVHV
jgi:hypothetical protein